MTLLIALDAYWNEYSTCVGLDCISSWISFSHSHKSTFIKMHPKATTEKKKKKRKKKPYLQADSN